MCSLFASFAYLLYDSENVIIIKMKMYIKVVKNKSEICLYAIL